LHGDLRALLFIFENLRFRMRTRLSVLCLCLFAVALAEAQQVSEREAVQKFLASTPVQSISKAQIEVTQAEWRSATLLPNPTFATSIEDSAGVRDQFLLFQQSLPLSGRLRTLKKAGSSAVSATEERARRRLQSAVADFRKVFLSLSISQRHEAILQANVARLSELVRILREREQAGEGSGLDLMRAERELLDAQADAKLAGVAVEQSRSRLASYVPDLASATISTEIETDPTLPSMSEAVSTAVQQRADYRVTRFELEQAAAQQRAAERLRIPEPTLSGGLKRTSIAGMSDNGFVAGLSIPLPFFNRGQADTARLRAEQYRLRGEQQLLQKQIEADVRANHAAAAASAVLANSYKPAATLDLLRAADTAYQEGERGILELLDAYRLVKEADLRSIELIRTAKEARIDFDLAMGAEVQP
jgi:cobalt-zinc-cadmium efflux system outer membrane protein